ncbi:YlbF family regulator [Anaerotignum sp. MB30-C6]|uniref:YlbF family regulator n=1 Tax=Anaerotignum sp. MB30-C6 TaxID=3070814 RepID=UPI0027DC2C75|nr:YlbF family regulator [Anaerotignum sp. MB30-C6]WMI80225.1 YlbF family regulator [Anaerotignum sp. MB30-C6]
MASVYDLARNLGEELMKTPQVEALLEAKKAYEESPEIAAAVEEYTKLHQEFEAKMQAGGISAEEQKAFSEDMAKRGEEIRNNKIASDLFSAEMNFNNFMNSIFTIVTSTLTGEEPGQSGCSPSSCASCGGGCH